MPAMKSSPTEVPDTTPYTIIPIEGGISSATSLALTISASAKESR